MLRTPARFRSQIQRHLLIVLAAPESDIEALSASTRSRTTIFGSITGVLSSLSASSRARSHGALRSVAEAVLEPVRGPTPTTPIYHTLQFYVVTTYGNITYITRYVSPKVFFVPV
ncbi:hypothetical protein BJ742DRAFT_775357 [Cladochytrium replicatum]|nr:hypothetical protein BJ742DRAFT_775357 [Cladochytrium replicatum]